MNATESTFPATFEEYLARWVDHGIGVEDHLDEIRGMYDRERLAHLLHPQLDDMPPCPPWCTFAPGHPYDSIDNVDVQAGMVTLLRAHSTEHTDGALGGCLSQDESLRGGRVTLAEPVVITGPDLESITAAEARRRAADLLNLADRLDKIAGASRSCPRSAAHEPHTWASMVPGEDWRCPGLPDGISR
jgi:hypothetical protein